ncbi:hypothetical protein NHX12_012327 [Muraenolepis orangiensis]|uniref:DUF393 domain-containing protein n=1 Tax=Muraenolepis orangiensis TaxID=630683 RepID=A0A9Q0DF82_9TELE|nr:hypothetical protein NHX12_012327 [Muraenolepis orangiensis]
MLPTVRMSSLPWSLVVRGGGGGLTGPVYRRSVAGVTPSLSLSPRGQPYRTFSTQPGSVRRNKPEKVTFVDISLAGYDGGRHYGVSYQEAMEEMHVVDERGQVHRGVPAFSVMYRAVGLGWLGRFMMCGPVRPLMDKGYAVFARNRLKWTGRGSECRTESCAKKSR